MSQRLTEREVNEQIVGKGIALAESAHLRELCESLPDRTIKDRFVKATTAIVLENLRKWLESQKLDETTKIVNVGSWDKYALPMVRAVLPNLIVQDLISVQPMLGPTSLIFYVQYLYSQTKGTATAGTDVLLNPNRYYTSETIDQETIGTGDGSTTTFTGTLSWLPIKPSTVTVTAGSVTGTDNGNGQIVGTGIATGTINYSTGAISVTFSTAPANGVKVNVKYDFNSEGNANLPEIDINLTSTTVSAVSRRLKAKWSIRAAYDMKVLQGIDAELELVALCTNEIRFEIDDYIVQNLREVASAGNVTFSKTVPAGISYTEHKLSFIDTLVQGSNAIFTATGRAVGNWIVTGIDGANIIETLPGFRKEGELTGRGVYYVGTLNNTWKVYKDSYYAPGNFLIGYKRSDSMWEVGAVFAPYLLMYTTPTIFLDDFLGRKAFASDYGYKVVDANFFCKGTVTS